MDAIRKALELAGLAIMLIALIMACAGEAEEGALEDPYGDSIPAAEQPVETDAPGDPAVPGTAVEEPDPESPGGDPATGEVEPGGPSTDQAALTDQTRAEERQRGICEAQRPSHPGEEYRVECTRAVTGDDRRESWQCACVWGG